MKKVLTAIVNKVNRSGDKKVYKFFFSKQYSSGCYQHPDLAEHQLTATELTACLKRIMKW
ncbi:MAG TPA: hypothetical protein VJU78_08420 [Chitinophagaceae bacterium]|nr:hypothetical protein [Chitinophagaceae bacterium]